MATENQQRASGENFAIFMLNGWKRFLTKRYMKGPLSRTAILHLRDAFDYAIADIKQSQAARRESRMRR
jgi:hypothetical protein